MRNKRAKLSKRSECDGRKNSIEITVPPMGIAVFTCTPEKAPVKKGNTQAKEKAVKAPAKAAAKQDSKADKKKPVTKNK